LSLAASEWTHPSRIRSGSPSDQIQIWIKNTAINRRRIDAGLWSLIQQFEQIVEQFPLVFSRQLGNPNADQFALFVIFDDLWVPEPKCFFVHSRRVAPG